jgi:hypothetical protein
MKQFILSAIVLITITVGMVGCAGLPGQAPQGTSPEQVAAVRSTFIAERGGADTMRFNGTVGTIASIDAGMITVEAPDGTTSNITLAEGSTVVQQSAGERGDIIVGESVTVMMAEGTAMLVQVGRETVESGAGNGVMTFQQGSDTTTAPPLVLPIHGTVQSIEGDTLTLSPTDGSEVVTALLNEQTMIEKRETVEVSTLAVGMTIFALGEADAEGIVQATEITILPAGLAPIRMPAPQ